MQLKPVRPEFMENECEALPGVAYPGVRDNRSTLNTKTGYDDEKRPVYVLVYYYTQYRNDFHNDSKPKHRKKPTQCTCYKNTTKLHVSVAAAIICTILGLLSTYMPNQRINMAQTETHSKILPSPTYMEIMKKSIGLSLFKVPNICQREDTSLRANRWTLQIEWTTAFTLVP